jgi:hypothetical protein
MKTLTLSILLAFVGTVYSSPALREARFNPATGAISLSVIEDGFSRSVTLGTSDLTESQQAAVGSVLAWLASQLPAGFQSVQSISLEMGPEVPATWGDVENNDDPPVMVNVPLTWRRTLNAAVTGTGPAGERTIVIIGGSSPVELSAGLLDIWDTLESSQAQ